MRTTTAVTIRLAAEHEQRIRELKGQGKLHFVRSPRITAFRLVLNPKLVVTRPPNRRSQ